MRDYNYLIITSEDFKNGINRFHHVTTYKIFRIYMQTECIHVVIVRDIRKP